MIRIIKIIKIKPEKKKHENGKITKKERNQLKTKKKTKKTKKNQKKPKREETKNIRDDNERLRIRTQKKRVLDETIKDKKNYLKSK